MPSARPWALTVLIVLLSLAPAPASADIIDFSNGPLPLEGRYLSSWGPGSLGVVVDGTSNTILLGENARVAVCFDGVSVGGGGPILNPITDGSSNTLLFGESAGLQVNVGRVLSRRPIAQITDGSSNTILIGEVSSSSFCLDDVRAAPTVTDGTSNTILIGETSHFDVCVAQNGATTCFENVQSPTGAASVPEPATAALLLGGLAATAVARRRARRRTIG